MNQREFSRVELGRVQGSVFIITRKQPGNPEKFDRDAKDKNERHEFFPSSLFYSSFLHYKSRLRSIKVSSVFSLYLVYLPFQTIKMERNGTMRIHVISVKMINGKARLWSQQGWELFT